MLGSVSGTSKAEVNREILSDQLLSANEEARSLSHSLCSTGPSLGLFAPDWLQTDRAAGKTIRLSRLCTEREFCSFLSPVVDWEEKRQRVQHWPFLATRKSERNRANSLTGDAGGGFRWPKSWCQTKLRSGSL